MSKTKISAIGVMSGTSLDGLDLCYAVFTLKGIWTYKLKAVECIPYDEEWSEKLRNAHNLPPEKLRLLNVAFGMYIGDHVNAFLKKFGLKNPDLVCSHGHTVFHEPDKGLTLQIGDGSTIAELCGITTVSDFRSLDVSLGGQGAPLVPIGDELLFPEFTACLNLGGFSNISFREDGIRRAFDICPVNIALNSLANELGQPYDKDGLLARSGRLNRKLLAELNALAVYQGMGRPSLSREWLEKEFMPLVDNAPISTTGKLRTVTEHAARQISSVINQKARRRSVLVTGGGVWNDFLIDRIVSLSKAGIMQPERKAINFKEALIFAFLGVLRSRNELNVLRSVTGAKRDSSSGVIHFPPS